MVSTLRSTDPGLGRLPPSPAALELVGEPRPAAMGVAGDWSGQTIGAYVVDHYLDTVPLARRFLVHHPHDGRRAMAYVPAADADGEHVQHFSRVIGALAAAPSLPHLLEAGSLADGSIYAVLPIYRGESLAKRLQGAPLSAAATVDLGIQIARAIQALRHEGIVVGDLDPQAILLEPQAEGAIAVRLADISSWGPTPTIGDERVDVLALGALLCRCLVGIGGSMSRLPRECPADLERLILRATSSAPDVRPTSGAVMEAELAWIAQDQRLPLGGAAWDGEQGPRPVDLSERAPASGGPRVSDTAAERAFFDAGRVSLAPPAPPPETLEFIVPRRRTVSTKWLPVVILLVAGAAALTAYALLVGAERPGMRDVRESMRAELGSPALAPTPLFGARPLTEPDYAIALVTAGVKVSLGLATPERDVVSLEDETAALRPAALEQRSARGTTRPANVRTARPPPPPTRQPPRAQAPSQPMTPATASSDTVYPVLREPLQRADSEWDALPEHREPRQTDNPYANTPSEEPTPSEEKEAPNDRGF
jgi:hypothetical protein